MSSTMLPVVRGREDAFSYACHACNRCCYHKGIQVNPYEIARLARNRGISTTELIGSLTEEGGTVLARRADGGCVFLGEEGCTVHADRPLVCRLYPLGRIVQADGSEMFVENEPHPETAGVYGENGKVADYLESQGVAPYFAASDRYHAVFSRMVRILGQQPSAVASLLPAARTAEYSQSDRELFLDVDLVVSREREEGSVAIPGELDDRVGLHLRLLECWLERLETKGELRKGR